MDAEVRGKLNTLLAGGLQVGTCAISMSRQHIERSHFIEGIVPVPSGVARLMELQELGYAYIRP